MRAVVRDEYGGPDVLKIEDIDKPELVDDGALARVRAAALYVLMRGFLRLQTGWRRPRRCAITLTFAQVNGLRSPVRPAVHPSSTAHTRSPRRPPRCAN